jgi:hydroxymethylpyrimidine pyrophosphatase-like HAD family hydrolase/fructoselysine-6-P-deglycase FrlB-like protein
VGKPYASELASLNSTYEWALHAPIDCLSSYIKDAYGSPMIAVGSGGSLTAAHLAVLLHQTTGAIAKVSTPLDLVVSAQAIRASSVLMLTAGGRNPDILTAFRLAATAEPRHLMAVCMQPVSPLATLASKFRYTQFAGYNPPVDKDGFLATNSLLGMLVIVARAYEELHERPLYTLPSVLPQASEIRDELGADAQAVLRRNTLVVLYGSWGLPAACDIESKFTEAALQPVQLADYRNFAHGRHHWLAKRGDETGVIALITKDEARIAAQTLSLLPKSIPTLRLATDQTGSAASLHLFLKVLYLVALAGAMLKIDPGRPGVPSFGRKIYHMRLPKEGANPLVTPDIEQLEAVSILRKSRHSVLVDMSSEELSYWQSAYRAFLKKLGKTPFGAIAFDYDGTLCDSGERYEGPAQQIVQELRRLLVAGVTVGIATGRGKSVRIDLQHLLPKSLWKGVLVGYYNGSDIAALTNNHRPDITGPLDPALQRLQALLENDNHFTRGATYECRPYQISVIPRDKTLWKTTKAILLTMIAKAAEGHTSNLRLLESSHSMDLLAPGVSKLHLVRACEVHALKAGNPISVLCIGDSGDWPGNDYQLLSTQYSLSVDTVSPDPSSCWNLSLPGHRGVQATLGYLKRVKAANGTLRFRFANQEHQL